MNLSLRARRSTALRRNTWRIGRGNAPFSCFSGICRIHAPGIPSVDARGYADHPRVAFNVWISAKRTSIRRATNPLNFANRRRHAPSRRTRPVSPSTCGERRLSWSDGFACVWLQDYVAPR